MENHIKNIVIVGGGSAGWLAAGVIAAEHGAAGSGVTVTLVESPDVSTIGVGEGTWPSMRQTLNKIGIAEADFIRECGASFKQGSKFIGWSTGEDGDAYYHPFMEPRGYAKANLYKAWKSHYQSLSFADAVSLQARLCEEGRAPKQFETPPYAAVMNYGYHLDAGKFCALLTRHCTEKLGVKHVLDHVTTVSSTSDGCIASLETNQSGSIVGDLFIDCSGAASLLIGKHFNVPFVSKERYLFNDTAIAIQVPYHEESTPIASATLSTAQACGWIWDIGLQHRRGVGYVYSSSHITDDLAEEGLRQYIARTSGAKAAELCSSRKLKINPGYRQQFWIKNCVAVGMAAGFIEPLEASALAMVELSVNMISDELPMTRESMAAVSRKFNSRFEYRWNRVIDFLKLHYVLTRRSEFDYWRDAASPESIPDYLRDLLLLWRSRTPYYGDFSQNEEVFPSASYQYVLYGMGFETQCRAVGRKSDNVDAALTFIEENTSQFAKYRSALPTNRDLIKMICSGRTR